MFPLKKSIYYNLQPQNGILNNLFNKITKNITDSYRINYIRSEQNSHKSYT